MKASVFGTDRLIWCISGNWTVVTQLKQSIVLFTVAVLQFPHSSPTLHVLQVAFCACLGLSTQPMCPDNPACTKKTNHLMATCVITTSSRPLQSNWLSLYWVWACRHVFTYTCRSFQTTAHDWEPVCSKICNLLAYWQEFSRFRQSGSRFRVAHMEM